MRLGKRPATHDDRDLRLARYVTGTVKPPASDTGNIRAFTDWGMLGNDTVGDCVFAGAGHETMLWTLEGGQAASFRAKNALADYSAVTGYDPADPNTDQGTDVRQALGYRRSTGVVDQHGNRHRIAAYVAVRPGSKDQIKTAVHLFDAVGIGFRFPDFAMDQFNAGKPWSLRRREQPDEGHYVPVIGYDSRYLYTVSWGRVQRMTWGFFEFYCDEAFALLSEEFLRGGKSPDGLDLATLQADLRAVTS